MRGKNNKEPVFEYTGGPASQTEKEVMHSTYGVLPDPQVTSDGKYRCPECGNAFRDLASYNSHRHKGKVKGRSPMWMNQ